MPACRVGGCSGRERHHSIIIAIMASVRILTHGGSSSLVANRDGTMRAAETALRAASEGSALEDCLLTAMDVLEDDPRFNAGTGSSLRADGKSIQMDAAFMAWRPTTD